MSVDEKEVKKHRKLLYAIVYYLEDDNFKRLYKGISTTSDNVSDNLWRVSNFMDDLLISVSDKPILFAMISCDKFPVKKLDALIKDFVKKNKQGIVIDDLEADMAYR